MRRWHITEGGSVHHMLVEAGEIHRATAFTDMNVGSLWRIR